MSAQLRLVRRFTPPSHGGAPLLAGSLALVGPRLSMSLPTYPPPWLALFVLTMGVPLFAIGIFLVFGLIAKAPPGFSMVVGVASLLVGFAMLVGSYRLANDSRQRYLDAKARYEYELTRVTSSYWKVAWRTHELRDGQLVGFATVDSRAQECIATVNRDGVVSLQCDRQVPGRR